MRSNIFEGGRQPAKDFMFVIDALRHINLGGTVVEIILFIVLIYWFNKRFAEVLGWYTSDL